jgi:DNA-binding NtrC family response regulator
MRRGDSIDADDLTELATVTPMDLLSSGVEKQMPLRALEKSYILMILDSVRGNKSRAAEILGMDRKTLYRKLEEFGQESSAAAGPSH